VRQALRELSPALAPSHSFFAKEFTTYVLQNAKLELMSGR